MPPTKGSLLMDIRYDEEALAHASDADLAEKAHFPLNCIAHRVESMLSRAAPHHTVEEA